MSLILGEIGSNFTTGVSETALRVLSPNDWKVDPELLLDYQNVLMELKRGFCKA